MVQHRCIAEDILKEFFLSHYDEVQKMVELDYTFENRLRMNYRDARKKDVLKELK